MADHDHLTQTTAASESPEVVAEVAKAEPDESPLTFLQILGSTFSAAIGVQSKANRERDFSRGKPLHFIFAGLIFAALFVVVIVTVVRTVLS